MRTFPSTVRINTHTWSSRQCARLGRGGGGVNIPGVSFTNSFFKHLLCAGPVLGAGGTVVNKVDEVGDRQLTYKYVIIQCLNWDVSYREKKAEGDRECHGLGWVQV